MTRPMKFLEEDCGLHFMSWYAGFFSWGFIFFICETGTKCDHECSLHATGPFGMVGGMFRA